MTGSVKLCSGRHWSLHRKVCSSRVQPSTALACPGEAHCIAVDPLKENVLRAPSTGSANQFAEKSL